MGSKSTAFGNQANWKPAVVPDVYDVAVFDTKRGSVGPIVTGAAFQVSKALVVHNGAFFLSAAGGTYTLVRMAGGAEGGGVVVGQVKGDNGSLTLNAGTMSGLYGFIGAAPKSAGFVEVAGATWDNSFVLYVGGRGSGNLMVTNGGRVTDRLGSIAFDDGSTGMVTVSGANSAWVNSAGLAVGDSGRGTLTVNGGGQVMAGQLTLGDSADASGMVLVQRPGIENHDVWRHLCRPQGRGRDRGPARRRPRPRKQPSAR